MALRSPHVRALAITTVAGNVAVQQATRNALYTAKLCGDDVAVFMEPQEPMNRLPRNFHIDNHGYACRLHCHPRG